MEISEKEYYELQMQVRLLQSRVEGMKIPKQTTMKDLVNEQVISRVWNLADDKPIFEYSRSNSDAWTQMLVLAKMIHEPSPLFYMDRTNNGYFSKPYIRSIFPKNRPRKISDLTPEELTVSVQMLNEIIPIYNKYFKQMHQRVIYDPTGKGDYRSIGVLDDDAEVNDDGTVE